MRYEWDDYPKSYIVLPDDWTGDHLERRDVARERGRAEGFQGGLLSFFTALELLDDFRLPGFEGPPKSWNIRETPLPIIARVNTIVWDAFGENWIVPKNSYGPSQNSAVEKEPATAQDGD